jgi:hypothetical protein
MTLAGHVTLITNMQLFIIISIQPLDYFGQEPEPSQATGVTLLRCNLRMFLGVVCHCFPPRLDVPTFAARCLHVRSERWNYGRERLSGNFGYMASLIHAIRYRRLYLPSEGRRAEDFFALKNPKASAGFEPANLGTKGHRSRLNILNFFSGNINRAGYLREVRY